MDTYIVRQPIVNREQQVEAYEIIYRPDSSVMNNQSDAHVAESIIAFFNSLEPSNFLEEKEAYLSFTPNLLIKNVPQLFDQGRLVIQFDESVLVSPKPRELLSQYKKLGFRLAFSSFDFNRRYLDFISMVDIMKVDLSTADDRHLDNMVQLARQYGMRTCAYHVDTEESMARAKELDFDLLQGTFVSQDIRSKVHLTDHLRSNFFRLMAAICCQTPDFDEIAEIISLDVTLTFSLLRIVNSAYFALPNRVSSVRQALTILGLNQLRNWIYLLSFSGGNDTPDELIRTSFLRGTFCQNLAARIPTLPVSSSELYMMGIFSTLDLLLSIPMEEAISSLPIHQSVKDALLGREGICSDLLQLCISYEKGDWHTVNELGEKLSLSVEQLAPEYVRSVEYVSKTWEALSHPGTL